MRRTSIDQSKRYGWPAGTGHAQTRAEQEQEDR